MAQIDPSKKPNPMVAALANFFCLGVLGYIMCGQTKKAIMIFIVTLVLSIVGLSFIPIILATLDVKGVAEALEGGEAVDENEYKFEILFKVMSIIDKSAVYNG